MGLGLPRCGVGHRLDHERWNSRSVKRIVRPLQKPPRLATIRRRHSSASSPVMLPHRSNTPTSHRPSRISSGSCGPATLPSWRGPCTEYTASWEDERWLGCETETPGTGGQRLGCSGDFGLQFFLRVSSLDPVSVLTNVLERCDAKEIEKKQSVFARSVSGVLIPFRQRGHTPPNNPSVSGAAKKV